jgi:hypothetical protein
MRDEPLDTKDPGWSENENENESDEDFQKRLEDAVNEMKTWDWNAVGNRYLDIAESVVRDCHSIDQLSNCQ